jgi:hypothetical protein
MSSLILFLLRAEMRSLGGRRVVAGSACPVAHLDPSTKVGVRCGLGSVVVMACRG